MDGFVKSGVLIDPSQTDYRYKQDLKGIKKQADRLKI
jgi:hypothetical protein